MKNIIYLGLCLNLLSCNFFAGETPLREAKAVLTQKYAMERSSQVSHISYQLKFDLSGKKNFQGTTAVQFQLKNTMFLTLDFEGGEIHELIVNDKKVQNPQYNGFFIEIPQDLQKVGLNSVRVKFNQNYSKNGTGLYKYVDVKDGRTYLYSHFEPYFANRMFPCFDQPDLKATFTTQVLAPKGWQVISSTRETDKTLMGEMEEWYFPTSAKFSTYTYSMHAGEYVVWEDIAKTKNHEIPLRLFARKSLAQYVQIEDWFTWTKQGFEFFEKYYSSAYPYGKYDQIIVPDFNHGAMENVAAVIWNEDRYVSKGKKTREQRRKLAATLFHEMAHMWFGNLVTMKWWDDLWLNESFATYSAYKGLAEATEFKEIWKAFSMRNVRSYRLDQSVNTHPVAQSCAHTQAAFANFDAITYGKGASVLRQLAFLIGDKAYGKGLKEYFETFAEQNTTLSDFMGTMEKSSGKDLRQWTNRWLKTAMLNNVEVHFTCKKGRINHFTIYQTGTKDYPTLRTHKTRLALFKKSRGLYKLNRTQTVEYSGESTEVGKLIGKICPDIVYPNFMDHDYVSVTLDKRSLKNIKGDLVRIQDAYLRSLIWTDLWGMVLNQTLGLNEYLEIVEYNALSEVDEDILNFVFNSVNEVLNKYFPDSGHPWVEKRQIWVKFFEQAFVTKIYETIDDPDRQRVWFDIFTPMAESEKELRLLEKIVKRHRSGLPLNFKASQDLRWKLIARLVEKNYNGALKLVEYEKKRDKSKRGEIRALYAESLNPNLKAKEKMFNDLVFKRNETSFGTQRIVMEGLFPSGQKSLHKKFVSKFYETLKKVSTPGNEYYASEFVENLAPGFCDKKSSTQMSKFLKAEKDLSFPVVKNLRMALFENRRCRDIRGKMMNSDGRVSP